MTFRVPGRPLLREAKAVDGLRRWRAADVSQRPGVRLTEADRPTQRAVSQARVAELEAFAADAYEAMYAEQRELVVGRLRGRKARRGTRHWRTKDGARPVEVKAIDPDYVLPGKWAETVAEYGEGVALHVATEAFADARRALGADELEVGVDSALVQDAVAEEVARLLEVEGAQAERIRDLLLDLDSTDADLDAMVDALDGTYAQRRAWAERRARDQVAGVVNGGGMAAARAAGVAVKEWLSSRDDAVRATHVVADGQVRPIDEPFSVGGEELDYPADPSGLPETIAEVAGCRCTLLFGRPSPLADPQPWQLGEVLASSAESLREAVDALFAPTGALDAPGRDGRTGAGQRGPLSALSSEPLVGYAVSERGAITPEIGTEVQAFAQVPLTLMRQQAEAAVRPGRGDVLLVVEVPAGAGLSREPGSLDALLRSGARLEVVAATDDELRLRLR